MNNTAKLLIAGVGGQGVVFLTDLIVTAAVIVDIPVSSSEIHGLSQRRGSVVSAVTFGDNTFGYIEKSGADYIIGLEPMESVRCLPYMHRHSRAIIDDNRILPHSVNTGKSPYPDIEAFIEYLRRSIRQVIFNLDFRSDLSPIQRNTYILGRALALDDFPVPPSAIERALKQKAKAARLEESIRAFRLGMSHAKLDGQSHIRAV